MKRLLALILSVSLLISSCAQNVQSGQNNATEISEDIVVDETDDGKDTEEIAEEFTKLSDPDLLQFVKDDMYAGITDELASEDYIIDDIQTAYVSKEYLDELAYNSKENIYFGFSLEEIEKQYGNTDYVFTVDDEGNTIVTEYTEYDDTYNQAIKDVAIGTGIILICVTATIVSDGVGAPATVSAIFAASAKKGAEFALVSAPLSSISAAVITGIKEKDFDSAIKAGAKAGGKSFKWAAISGVVVGGVSKAIVLQKAAGAAGNVAEAVTGIPTPRESELYALEQYGGTEQLSYLAGKEVPFGTPHATRPDVIREVNGHLEAIEVKNYNLESSASCNTLYSELERQVKQRVSDLPVGSTQRIVLDTRGRGFSAERVETVKNIIRTTLSNVYPNIPIDVLR